MPNKKRPEFLLSFGRFNLYIIEQNRKGTQYG